MKWDGSDVYIVDVNLSHCKFDQVDFSYDVSQGNR